MFVPKWPRVISIDVNGEAPKYNPDAIECTSVDEVLDVALFARVKGFDRWHVQAVLDRAELPRLFRILAPEYKGSAAPPSITRAVGGIAVECSEAYAFAPNAGAHPDVLESFFRGRHHGLAFLLAAQRATALTVAARSQADVLVAFRTTDPNELTWAATKFGVQAVDHIRTLEKYHCAMYVDGESSIYWLNDKREVVRRSTPHAEVEAPPVVNDPGVRRHQKALHNPGEPPRRKRRRRS